MELRKFERDLFDRLLAVIRSFVNQRDQPAIM